MELRVLEYFLAVVREESISAAAESLHLSQPTLSRQLKDLEDALGKQLLIRGNRKIKLTEEGMLLRKRAEEIIGLVRKAESEISLSDDHISGDVFIGAGETDGVRLIARIAQKVRSRYPDIHYHVVSGDTSDIVEKLDRGLIDFALLFDPIDLSRFDCRPLPIKDRWGVLMRRDDPLAQCESITMEQLKTLPLIVSRLTDDNSELFKHNKLKPSECNIVATYNLLFNASLMVDEGMGYALALDRIINTGGDSNLCFRLISPLEEAGMSVVWKKYPVFSKAASKFLAELQNTF